MSQIETCYLRDGEGCDLESCADCGYYKLVVENANSLQQLKAEIAAISVEVESIHDPDTVTGIPVGFYNPKIIPIAIRLRQLSAV